MHIDQEIIRAAAELIAHGASELPLEDQVEHSGLDERQALILEDTHRQLTRTDP